MKDKETYDKVKDAKWTIIEAKKTIDEAACTVLEHLTHKDIKRVKKALKLLDKVTWGLEVQMASLQSEELPN